MYVSVAGASTRLYTEQIKNEVNKRKVVDSGYMMMIIYIPIYIIYRPRAL